MSKKKILWIILLIVVIIGVIVGVVLMNNASQKQKAAAEDNSKSLGNVEKVNTVTEVAKTDVKYEKLQLDDGVLYTSTGKKEEADMVIGTNYYDTTITDMYYNPQNYMNKKIEIEGMYLVSDPALPYTFVGRYSLNTLCPSCPPGYSVLEYQLQGNIDKELTNEVDWIKVVGILDKGNDETSNYNDYYFLKVLNLEVMNEMGQATVNN